MSDLNTEPKFENKPEGQSADDFYNSLLCPANGKKNVFSFFAEISEIPRGSKNEKAVSDYIASFAKEKGLRYLQDTALNVIIWKPASKGYENHAPIILQGHMDMVCEKNAGTVHDFLSDPLRLRVDGDFIYADGTTLGADNGIACALMMALLDADDAVHPPLECVFTTDEEAGMSGVAALDASQLKSKRMLNLDSSDEGVFYAGCAGGSRATVSIPLVRESCAADNSCSRVIRQLTVRGLAGGHSGIDINKEHGNSIRVLGRALRVLLEAADVRIIKMSGGLKTNAIPREAEALIAVKESDAKKVHQLISALQNTLQNEYRVSDPGVQVSLEVPNAADEADAVNNPQICPAYCEKVFSSESAVKAIAAILALPNGVLAMSQDIPGLVETSNNIGVMETTENELLLHCAIRSMVSSRRAYTGMQIRTLAEALGIRADIGEGYPGWEYNPDSALREEALACFREMYGKEALVEAKHAGLECGFMLEKIPGLDVICLGADQFDIHTPNEHVSISSVKSVWKFLLELLKRL